MTTNQRIIKNSNGGAIEITGTLTNNGSPVGGGFNPATQSLAPTGTTQTIDWSLGNVVKLDLHSATGDITPTLLNPVAGVTYFIKVTQAATARQILWPVDCLFDQNGWLLSLDNDNIDIISMTYNGTNYFCSIVNDATVPLLGYTYISWGSNGSGQLGDGTLVTKSSPVAGIGLNTKYVLISAGQAHNAALKSNGSAWAWGNNTYGQLGTGRAGTAITSPVHATGGHSFISIVAGGGITAALKIDGSVWCYGANSAGELGDGTTASKSSPISVIGGHSFGEVITGGNISSGCYVLARKADGSVWAWGLNTAGQLGDGTIISKSSPISVVGGHSFVGIACTTAGTSMARKADGSVWCWGTGNLGELGDGASINKSSPVSVIGGHSFIQIVGGAIPMARKADGSVWSWGSGSSGMLGDGTIISRSSPVSIPNLTITSLGQMKAGSHAIVLGLPYGV